MNSFTFRLVLALIGLFAFLALVGATAYLGIRGQTGWAAFTGSGAVAVGIGGLYKLLVSLGLET